MFRPFDQVWPPGTEQVVAGKPVPPAVVILERGFTEVAILAQPESLPLGLYRLELPLTK